MRVERSDQAIEDVDEIWWFVAQDSERAADRLVDLLAAAFFRVGEFPHMGVARDDLAPSLRALRFGNYVVFYRAMPEVVVIERVLHARLDTSRITF